MFANLTPSQRMALTFLLLTGGQVLVAAGVFLGWQPGWVVGGSATLTAAAILLLATGGAVLRDFLSAFSAHASRIAAGDLTQDVPVRGSSDAAAVLRSLQELQESLRGTLGAIRGGADGVSVAAQEIATGNADLSTRTEQTASNLQQAASSMAQLTTKLNARSADFKSNAEAMQGLLEDLNARLGCWAKL